MSGGPATACFAKESAFMDTLVDSDSDGNTDYYEPGRNVSITNVELSNALDELRVPDDPEVAEHLAQNLEGAFGVEWSMSSDRQADVHDIIFNDAGSGFVRGQAATSRWYLGIDHWAQTAQRELLGVTPTDYTVEYTGDGVNCSLTAVYGDEKYNTTITPSSIQTATEGTTVASHGTQLQLSAVAKNTLQSCTLSISNIARFERGPPRKPLNAVIASPQTQLDASVLWRGSTELETAYGTTGATTPADSLDSVTGTLTFDSAAASAATYNLPSLDPESYNWSDLVSTDTSLTENITFNVAGGVTVS